jgi:hypothetical protein
MTIRARRKLMRSRTFKTAAAAVGLLGAIVTGNAWPGTAIADTNDDQFIGSLGAVYGIDIGGQRSGFIANAHASCQSLEAGQSEVSVEGAIGLAAPHLSADGVRNLLRAEELYYCEDFYR